MAVKSDAIRMRIKKEKNAKGKVHDRNSGRKEKQKDTKENAERKGHFTPAPHVSPRSRLTFCRMTTMGTPLRLAAFT